jgi:histidine ammonia-lyase
VAIELIAAQGAPMTSSALLEPVRTSVRERVERLDRDRHLAPDIAAAAEFVHSGARRRGGGRAVCLRRRNGMAGLAFARD